MAWYNPQMIFLVIALSRLFCNASVPSTKRKPFRIDSQSTSNNVSILTIIPASNKDQRQLEFEATTTGTSHWIREGTTLITPRFLRNTEADEHPTQIPLTHHGNSGSTENSGSFPRSSQPSKYSMYTVYRWNKETTSAKDFLLGYDRGVCRGGEYTNEFAGNYPVVFPCECTPGCEMYGTCCPDNATDLMSASYTRCSRSGWYVLAKCPAGWDDDGIRENCEEWRFLYPYEDLVSDPSTNVTYRNAFCALCHGVSSLTRWTVNVRCSNFQQVYSAVNRRELLPLALEHGCDAASSPPDGTDPHKCEDSGFSNLGIVSSCDTTGLSKGEHYDKDVAANCRLYTTHSLRVRYYQKVYQNLFCAICNGAVPIQIDRPPDPTKPPIVPPFSFLLGLSDRDGSLGERANRECLPGLWRNLKEECQTLTCTPGKVLKNNTCITALRFVSGLSYYLNISLGPSEPVLLSLSNLAVFHAEVKQKVFEKLVDLSRWFELSIFIDSWPSTNSPGLEQIAQVRVIGYVHTYHNTSRDDAEFAFVHTLFYTDWNIVFKDRSIRLTPTYISQPAMERLALPRQLKVRYAPGRGQGPDINLVPLSPALICPYVKFSHNTFKLQAAGDRGENTRLVLTALEGEAEVTDLRHTFLDKGSLYVCYDALKKLRRPTRGSADLDWQYVLTMVVMPLSMLCLLLTLAVYCLLPSLRTQPGHNTMCMCTALLLAQLSLLVAVHAQGTTSRPWCQVLGAVVHAAWLSVFCWTSICSMHMFRAFSAKTYSHESLSSKSRCCSWQTACNIGISVVVPVSVTGVVAVARFMTTKGRSVGYSEVSCYLESTLLVGVSMVLPASLLLLFNLTLFVLTVRRIHEVIRLNPHSEDQHESQLHVHVCARLSLLTGITWLIAFVAEGLNVEWLQFVSILANGGQGVIILQSYATTSRIVAMLAVKFGWEPRKKSSSSQSTNTTSQSGNA